MRFVSRSPGARASARLCSVALALSVALSGGAAHALTLFSTDGTSPGGPSDSDIFSPGGIGGPPVTAISDGALGIEVPGTVELDAMTFGAPAVTMFFSVDRSSVGVPGAPPDVFSEAAVGQAAADVYTTGLGGTNILFINQDVLGLLPPIPAGVPAVPPIDNLDALDLAQIGPVPMATPVPPGALTEPLFSLTSGNAFGVSGADLWAPGRRRRARRRW